MRQGGEAATCKEILQVQNEECGKQINGCSAKSGTGIAVCGMELLRETA